MILWANIRKPQRKKCMGLSKHKYLSPLLSLNKQRTEEMFPGSEKEAGHQNKGCRLEDIPSVLLPLSTVRPSQYQGKVR